MPVLCSTLEFAPASALRNGKNSQSSSNHIVEMHSLIIHGRTGRSRILRQLKVSSVCLADRAAGVRARTCHGNLCGRNLSWKSLTSTCRGRASVTCLSSADGEPTRTRAIAPTLTLKWFRRKNWPRFFLKAASYLSVFFFHRSRHSRVGSSSGSGVSCGGFRPCPPFCEVHCNVVHRAVR